MQTDSEPPDWSGTAQRRKLTGFARIRAVLWARSVQLAEIAALGGRPWYWKLKWKLWWIFRKTEFHDPGRVESSGDIYGTTPLLTLSKLLEIAGALRPAHERTFLDLGCGMGQLVLGASCMGYRAVGWEKEANWVAASQLVARELGQNCEFHSGDLFSGEWPTSGLVFVVATAFDDEQRERLIGRFLEQPADSLFILGDMEAERPFTPLWRGKLPVDWGIIPFGIYRRAGD